MDSFLYEATIDGKQDIEKMLDKQVLYCLDQNGGSYNGQIQIDTSTLSNSGRWMAFSEGYLEIPFQITLQSSTNISANDLLSAFTLGLKNGYHQLIDSIQVDYRGKNVVQLQPFTNFYVGYKLMSSLSADDLKKWGSTIGFEPDTATSFSYSAGASANG